MISKKEFIDLIKELPKTIPSKTKSASYTRFNIQENILYFKRVNTGELWFLNIDQLYDIYRNNILINTTVIKKTTNGRVNSPSVAVLMAIKCIDANGNRIK